MKRTSKVEAKLEAMLREGASAARRSAPRGLAARVMSEVRAAEVRRAVATRPTAGGWRRAAMAAAVALIATLAGALVLLSDAPPPIVASNGASPGIVGSHPEHDAGHGPVAMLASLHRAPQDIRHAVGDAMNREFNQILEDAWREQQLFLARLPLRGRIDHEADGVQ